MPAFLVLAACAAAAAPGRVVPSRRVRTTAGYRNPILRDVADPFVLKHRGEYFLYCTTVDGTLDVRLSRDLVKWKRGRVVWRPDSQAAINAADIWAPEVYYENGLFYLYFNAGAGEQQRLWLATSDNPLGPFRTHPRGELTKPWRIDASMFLDDDGRRYLYSCRMREDRGAQVEGRRIESPSGPAEGEWATLIPPEAEWEGIWTEGPTVLKDEGGYYLLYSAPGAHLPTYQVGYAVASSPLGPWKKRGILIPAVPGVPGPGHQGVVLAPDNLTPYLVYHRKRMAERGWHRDLMLDRLRMGGGRLATRAPTLTPQALPPIPAFRDWFDTQESLSSWSLAGGRWRVDEGAKQFLQESAAGKARAWLDERPLADCVVEVNLRRLSREGAAGVVLATENRRMGVMLSSEGIGGVDAGSLSRPLVPGFDPGAYHQLLLTRQGGRVDVRLDGHPVTHAAVGAGGARLELMTENCAAAFSGVAVTEYARPLPLGPPESRGLRGWRRNGPLIEQTLLGIGRQVYPIRRRLPLAGSLSTRVRGWAVGAGMPFPKYGLQIRGAGGDRVEAFIDPASGVLATHGWSRGRELPWRNSNLPLRFDYTTWHEIGARWDGSGCRLTVDGAGAQWRGVMLRQPLRVELATEDARAVFSSVRVKAYGGFAARR